MEGISEVIVPYKGYKEGWNIIMYNDNVNTMETVMDSLMDILDYDDEIAEQLTMNVHEVGYCVVAHYPKEVSPMVPQFISRSFGKRGVHTEYLYEEKAKCKIHPRYKGIRKPTSKKEGCTCRKVYEEKQSEKRTH